MPDSSDPIDAEIVPDPPVVPSAPAVPATSLPATSSLPEASRPEPPDVGPPVPAPDFDERGVPSFDHVRSKIEGRYATSIGATELVGETPEARSLDEQEAERAKAAKAKLEEIRRSLQI